MNDLPLVADADLEYESDLVCTLGGVPFTGIAYEESPSGRSEISFRNGLQEGLARDWYPGGGLKAESHFVQSVLHGLTREFDESGRVTSEADYEYGIQVLGRRYSADGVLLEVQDLDPESELAKRLASLRREHRWPG